MVRGGAVYRSLKAAQLLEQLGQFAKLRLFVFDSSHAIQTLSELLTTVMEVESLNKTAVFLIKTPALVLDIDIAGLDRGKLSSVLQRQKNSFFSAGELM